MNSNNEINELKPKSLINYNLITSQHQLDSRYQREQSKSLGSITSSTNVSSTFDAFTRLAAGLEGRSLFDKINDSNRPTWESYKKINEDKLSLDNIDAKKMVEYRTQLDKDREDRLSNNNSKKRKSNLFISDDESDNNIESSDNDSKLSKHKKVKSKNKDRKHKKDKKDKKKAKKS